MLADLDCMRPTAVGRNYCFTNTIRFGDVRGVTSFASGNWWKAHFRLMSWNRCRKPNRRLLLSDNLYFHLENLIDHAIARKQQYESQVESDGSCSDFLEARLIGCQGHRLRCSLP